MPDAKPKSKAAKAVPVKKAASRPPKKVAAHPPYAEMIKAAVTSLKERGGSSRQAIIKYIMEKYNVGADEKMVNAHLKVALRAGVKNGTLKQAKGTGASGSFKMGEVKKDRDQPKTKAQKPKTAKVSSVSKAKTVKPKSSASKPKRTTKQKSSTKTKKAKDGNKKAAAKKAPKRKTPKKPKETIAKKLVF